LELLKKDVQYLKENYKGLVYNRQAGTINGELSFDLKFNGITIKDKYKIEILLSEKGLGNLPKVRETENRILNIALRKKLDYRDLHLINERGFLCLGIPPEIKERYLKGFELEEYLRHIEEHLYWVSFYEIYDKAPWKEHGHDIAGLRKLYTNRKMRPFVKKALEKLFGKKMNRSETRSILT